MFDFTRFQAPVWDRFFDFVSDCDDGLTDEQVREELRRRGIDIKRAFGKVQQALRSANARAELERAKQSRPTILEKLRRIKLPEIGGTLDDVKRAISQQLQGRVQVQGTFFRKLEAAGSEEDLRSLLEDAQILDLLGKEDAHDGTEAQ